MCVWQKNAQNGIFVVKGGRRLEPCTQGSCSASVLPPLLTEEERVHRCTTRASEREGRVYRRFRGVSADADSARSTCADDGSGVHMRRLGSPDFNDPTASPPRYARWRWRGDAACISVCGFVMGGACGPLTSQRAYSSTADGL